MITNRLLTLPRRRLISMYNKQRLLAIRNAPPLQHFLRDTYNRDHDYLRISITERCNLRCMYCMPESGVDLQPDSAILTTDEIIGLAELFVRQGVKKIRLTGGEPTVRKDVVEIVSRLNKIKGLKEICITSNGIALHRKLDALVQNGLTSLNLSLDTLIEGKFTLITRRNGLNAVLKSLETALKLKVPKVKLNVVIVKGLNDDEILNFVELARWYDIELRFIEYMPFDGNKWEPEKIISYQQILDIIKSKYPQINQLRHKYGETSKIYKIMDHIGKIGFITSMTSDFCGDCTRLRITSDGNLKVCLFDNNEVSIRDLLRSGASEQEILNVIGKAVKGKKEKHAGLEELSQLENRPMILIGDNSTLTHLNQKGEAHMVDISDKTPTRRIASAIGRIKFSNDIPILQIRDNSNKKGDVLSVARLSGISAIKKTSELVILCHPLPLTKCSIEIDIVSDTEIKVKSTVQCDGKTGVEMEALMGVQVALLNIYDMCKAVDKGIVIDGVQVVKKVGGKSDFALE